MALACSFEHVFFSIWVVFLANENKNKKCQHFFWSLLYKIYFWLMLLNFKILAFFWRQFYQEKRERMSVRKSRPCLRRVRRRKRVQWWPSRSGKSKAGRTVQRRRHLWRVRVSGRSGPEIGTDLHLLQVRGLRPIRSGNSDKTNFQKRLLGFPSYMKPSLKISWWKWSVYIFESLIYI